jgi:hypothetical protein
MEQIRRAIGASGTFVLMPKTQQEELDLSSLTRGQPPGVTPAFGLMALEAGSVIFEHNGHRSGLIMEVRSPRRTKFCVKWPPLHPHAKAAHNDLPEAAHYGAYGVAFLLTAKLTAFTVIERSYKGTGFDYWLGSGDAFPFQKAARLEVSGIVNDPGRLRSRTTAKKKQTDRSAGTLPAYVAVVEFGTPQSVFEER